MDYNYETDNGAILLPNFIPYIRFFPNPVQNDNTTDLGVDSIDAADYDYELDTYDTDFPGEKYLLEYVVYDANPVQSDSTTDVKISSSVDAAAASLQLGTNNEETQAIEISSSEVTTTIYGPVSMINILNASSIELTSNLNVSGQTTLMNVSTQALTATSLEVTGKIKTSILDFGYSSNPILSTTSAGYSVRYEFTGNLDPGSTFTLASFSNQPVGIYLLTVGPTTIYDFITSERIDIQFTTINNVSPFTNFNSMENGGNLSEKFGICFTIPIKITNATNALVVSLVSTTPPSGSPSGASLTGGSSCITRIA